MNTIKQYAAFLQQNPNMTQEYAMKLLCKTRSQIKNYERVAGVKLKKYGRMASGLTLHEALNHKKGDKL